VLQSNKNGAEKEKETEEGEEEEREEEGESGLREERKGEEGEAQRSDKTVIFSVEKFCFRSDFWVVFFLFLKLFSRIFFVANFQMLNFENFTVKNEEKTGFLWVKR